MSSQVGADKLMVNMAFSQKSPQPALIGWYNINPWVAPWVEKQITQYPEGAT